MSTKKVSFEGYLHQAKAVLPTGFLYFHKYSDDQQQALGKN